MTKEEKENRIAQIDNRLQVLSRTMNNHPENIQGFQKLCDLLMSERNNLR